MKSKNLLFALATSALLLASCGNDPVSSSGSVNPASSDEAITSKVTSSEAPLSSPSSESSEASSESSSTDPGAAKRIVRIAYHNDDNSMDKLAIYAWGEGTSGKEYAWDGMLNENFAYKDFDMDEEPMKYASGNNFFFIIKKPNTWAGQSNDTKVDLSSYTYEAQADGSKILTVYANDGGGGVIETHKTMKEAMGATISKFEIDPSLTKFNFASTEAPYYVRLYIFDETFYDLSSAKKSDPDTYESYRIWEKVGGIGDSGSISLADLPEKYRTFDPHLTYKLQMLFNDNVTNPKTKRLNYQNAFDSKKFIENYTYGGDDLGIKYSKEATEFRLWAPTSTKAKVLIYDYGTPTSLVPAGEKIPNSAKPSGVYEMTLQKGGVYSCKIEGDLDGKFYLFRTYHDETNWLVHDPYAKATGINGVRDAILDFSKTSPENFQEDIASLGKLASPNQLSIYEAHVRDFTSDDSWNGKQKKGTYNAFVEEGTAYEGVSTGFDHLKDFGVNAVQLLPAFDQENDERSYSRTRDGIAEKVTPAYNWGYNPSNYNVVEGSYSTDPYSPTTRIKEYKGMVAKLAKNGIRTIMDVVYNHVSSVATHAFNEAVPGYYFRYDEGGYLINDTGVGNTVNSDRVMASNFIVDSVKWWANEYGIKGFRFDLMGCIDTGTMRKVKDAVYDIDPSIVVYGEPWTGGGSHASSASDVYNVYTKLKDNGKGAVGCFNNGGRDGLKGDTQYGDVTPSWGFINKGADDLNREIKWNAAAEFIGKNGYSTADTFDPNQTVNYVSCHDNYTLFDQLNYTLRGTSGYPLDTADVHDDEKAEEAKDASMAVLAATMFSQGIGFIQGGDEFFRSKVMSKDDGMYEEMKESYKGKSEGHDYIEGDGIAMSSGNWLVRNSYKYGDAVNSFKWNELAANKERYEKVKEAVALRNAEMGNALGKSKAQIDAGYSTMWGSGYEEKTSIIAAYMHGDKDNKKYYAFLGGRTVNEYGWADISIGECNFKVVYSSNNKHDAGAEFHCNGILGAGKFEFLVGYVLE